MNDKLFFVDRSTGIRKTYAEFVLDVNAIRSVPNICAAGDQYTLLTTLVASLCSDQDIALSQNSSAYSEQIDPTLLPVQPILRQSELWNRIATSKSKIGLFTSGTTGRAKFIQHRMDSLIRSIRNTPHHQRDVWGLTYHPASFAGLQVVLQAICNSNPLFRLAGLDSELVHDEIQSMGITHISATPTWLRLICSDNIVHDGVTHITTGGEIVDRSLIDQAYARFPSAIFRNIYASTESGSVLLSDGDLFRVPANLADKVKVEDGILAIHRTLLAESMQSHDASEFYVTGDFVDVLTENPLTFLFTARRNDWINVGGNKVNSHEIERLLVAIDGVADARVFGRKSSVTGSIVCCEIVRSAGLSITQVDIRQAIEMQVESCMVPRFIGFVDAIDNTPTGKKDRSE